MTRSFSKKVQTKKQGNPAIINRRKYRRMPLVHVCDISSEMSGKTYKGKMVNISANGFAFSTRAADIKNAKGMKVSVQVRDLPVLGGRMLVGHVIRVSDNEGEYTALLREPDMMDTPPIQMYIMA